MRKVKILLIALILVLGGVFFGDAYAATRNLGANLFRPFADPNYTNPEYQYSVPFNEITDVDYTVVKIHDENDKEGEALAYTKALYCLRGGVGFGAQGEDISTDSVQYTEIGEMHTDANIVINKFVTDYINAEGTADLNAEIEGKTVNLYDAVLWIIDEAYLPADRINAEGVLVYDASEYRAELLSKAGVPKAQQAGITDNDIEVIQQLAMWYFTNYDEQQQKIKPTVSQARKFVAQFISINGNNNINDERVNNLDRLYQYLIYGAIENADKYEIDETTGTRIKSTEENKFDKTNPLEITSHDIEGIYDYYEVGPIKFQGNAGDRKTVDTSNIILYDAKGNIVDREVEIAEQEEWPDENGDTVYGEVTSGGKHTVYKFLDENEEEVTTLIKGNNYKIRIYKAFEQGNASAIPDGLYEKYDMSKFTVKVTSSYTLSKATFLSAGADSQPVVEIEKEKISSGDEITIEEPKYFDLALRKFIFSINGIELTGANSRVPNIDLSKLNTIDTRTGNVITTAIYTHPKNPLLVETGNKVVYTIRIYNEGELDGIAAEITDYLPEGLELVPADESAINTQYGWVAGEGNSIKIDKLKNTIIKAYDPSKTTEESGWQKATTGDSGLYYADVQVECKVVAGVTDADQQLRNIAEISEDKDVNGNDVTDRDSTPNDVDINDYTPPTDNSEYQQDDDDYEDLVLKPKTFDLSLRKFITKIERINKETSEKEELPITSREPQIKIAGLKAGETTAKYVHPKNTLTLKRGDIITYTIRVYNEGELDGYAKEVKDYLPEGLELVEGENAIWTVDGNTLTTTSLNDKLLLGYNKEITSVEDGVKWQKASDDETGLYYYDLTVVCKIEDDVEDNTILKNVAEISVDESKPTDINDRDSVPGNVYDDDNHAPGEEVEGYTPGEQDDDDFERVKVEPKEVFDLALRKYIVAINEENVGEEDSRIPTIDINPLKAGETTADYKHRKDPVEVKVGDEVTYRFTTYNEGELTGYVYSIKDYLPEGLEFLPTQDFVTREEIISYKAIEKPEEELTEEEKTLKAKVEAAKYEYSFDSENRILEIANKEIEIMDGPANVLWSLNAFDGTTLDSKSIDVKFKVTIEESNDDQILTNVATMTYSSKGGSTPEPEIIDRDSSDEQFNVPTQDELVSENETEYKGKETNQDDLTDKDYHYEGQQDDDDFEKIIIKGKPFDLALRKFITSIKRNGEEVEFEDRTPSINTETLINGTFDRNGNKEFTATYEHSKEPLIVKQGDIVTYTLRIYNEGERAGYATEITDYIPEGLALIKDYKTNFDNGWRLPEDLNTANIMQLVGENGFYKTEEEVKNLKLEDFSNTASLSAVQLITGEVSVTTSELEDELINAFDKTSTEETAGEGWQKAETGEGGLYYKDVQLSFLVIAPNTSKDVLTNVAEISEDKDAYGKDVTDRDSTPDNVTDKNEDDDDYEPVILRYFDLALRKFITGVETNGKLNNVTSRIPQLSIDEKTGNIKYTHPKEEEPVIVANNDIVIYTLRVYNEGTLAGYAEKITDDIPEGLEYLPEYSINKKYEWIMIDKDGKETENVDEAVKITTDYLSEGKVVAKDETGKSEIRDNLINPFDSSAGLSNTNPSYKDVKVAFKVTEPNTSDRIIVNSAQISEDSDDDEDSIPDEWNDPEDDQDKEYIYVKYFDLSLLKWVTKTIVTVDGKTTTTETGFKPNTGLTETTGIRDNKVQEPVAKVEIDKKKLNKTTVKFAYKIRVTNEGEIAGYATEITDFIPEGLEFKAEDNKKYGWVKEGKDKVTTRALETVLLEPGESAELEIIFTWKKDKNNLGLKTNIAEITEDYNEHNSPDIDSVPDNKEDPYKTEQEDDDDFALVILSIKTGKGATYTLLITAVITILASGIYLIKRYVLTY